LSSSRKSSQGLRLPFELQKHGLVLLFIITHHLTQAFLGSAVAVHQSQCSALACLQGSRMFEDPWRLHCGVKIWRKGGPVGMVAMCGAVVEFFNDP
jgi:hypothetical protein